MVAKPHASVSFVTEEVTGRRLLCGRRIAEVRPSATDHQIASKQPWRTARQVRQAYAARSPGPAHDFTQGSAACLASDGVEGRRHFGGLDYLGDSNRNAALAGSRRRASSRKKPATAPGFRDRTARASQQAHPVDLASSPMQAIRISYLLPTNA